MNKLLKDAIADAKAVRETALANAKAALEEAFAPKLQSMLSHKIKEEMDSTEGDEDTDDEGKEAMEIAKMQNLAGITEEDEDYSDEDMPSDDEDMPSDDEDYSDEDDFSDEDVPSDDEDMPSDEGDDVSDEDLEEILRELEKGSDEDGMDEETELDPNSAKYDADAETMEAEDPEAMEMDEEIDLEEIIRALREEDESEEEEEDKKETESKMEAVTFELNEAYSVIKFLRGKLNEVNLLNAKLLFVNKLFRKGQLSETQKVKIIETFDRAKNVREAKLIYATLSESVNNKAAKVTTTKKKMTEGFASAPQKSTKVISEGNEIYSRFKTLVNYNR